MAGFKRVGTILLIFLGPGAMIYYISKTFENHFIRLPYIGTTYEKDSTGNIVDSTLFTLGDISLTTFDGKPVTRDSLEGKIIVLSTLQNTCPTLGECGMGIYHFNTLIFEKMVDNQKNYHNVKVISILTDENGLPVEQPSSYLVDNMAEYDKNMWWMTTGDPTPFYSFDYYGDKFLNYPSDPTHGEIGTKAFINSLVLFDDQGHVRGVSGAKSDSDIRNFFDLLKLLKKEEFDAKRGKK